MNSTLFSARAATFGALALLGMTAPAAHAIAPLPATPTVQDGSFETPVTSSYVYNPAGSPFTFSTTINGFAGAGIASSNSAFNNGTAPDGNQVGFIQDHGFISQVINGFTVGQSYDVSFLTAGRTETQNGPNKFSVFVTDGALGIFNPTNDAINGYQSVTTDSFVATSNSETLTFKGLDTGGGDRTSFIDKVQINPVPEASSTVSLGLLLALGLGGMVIARKKSVKA